MGDLAAGETAAQSAHRDLLDVLERSTVPDPTAYVALRVMLDAAALPGELPISTVAEGTARALRRVAGGRTTLPRTPAEARTRLETSVLPFWSGPVGRGWFEVRDDRFAAGRPRSGAGRGYLAASCAEIVDWRLAEGLRELAPSTPAMEPTPYGFMDDQEAFVHGPNLWREYMRQDIPALLGETFNKGAWNAGVVPYRRGLVLLVTLDKGGLARGGEYEDGFESAQVFRWQSQTRTRRDDRHGRILSGRDPGEVHLFVRRHKVRNGRAAPFRYCGRPVFLSWEGDQPITVRWRLPEPVPPHLFRVFGIT